jgi:hypothetical protein
MSTLDEIRGRRNVEDIVTDAAFDAERNIGIREYRVEARTHDAQDAWLIAEVERLQAEIDRLQALVDVLEPMAAQERVRLADRARLLDSLDVSSLLWREAEASVRLDHDERGQTQVSGEDKGEHAG